jgi:hypothetical protein
MFLRQRSANLLGMREMLWRRVEISKHAGDGPAPERARLQSFHTDLTNCVSSIRIVVKDNGQ